MVGTPKKSRRFGGNAGHPLDAGGEVDDIVPQ